MRQIFLDKGIAVVKEVSEPVLDDYSVLVAVHYSFISSGTEIATITGAQSSLFSNVPHKVKKVLESVSIHGVEGTAALIKGKLKGEVSYLGYSCSGRVLAVGKKVRQLRSGDLVACAGAGYAHHADLVCVPEHLVVKIDKCELLKQASITTIGAIALQGIRRANVQLGEWICVIGLGLLGQLTVQCAKQAGCIVIGIDLISQRLQLAKVSGADYVFHASQDEVAEEIGILTQRYGVDTSIITAASKSNTIVQQAVQFTRRKGRVVIVGDVNLDFDRELLYQKELDILMSCSYGPGRYDTLYEEYGQDYPYAYVRWTENRNMQAFVRLLEQNKFSIDHLISKEILLDEIAHIYKRIEKKELLGVILSYVPDTLLQKKVYRNIPGIQKQQSFRFIPAVKDIVRIGIIGAGGFAKVKLLPIIASFNEAKISAIIDPNIAAALSMSRVYNIPHTFSHEDDLFVNDLVDMVIIASPHKYHYEQAIKALSHGKAVFLEKPMVTNYEQLQKFKLFLQQHPLIPLCVDFNRSFSPFMQKIKQVVQERDTPLMMHYRMNVGFIPKDHWVQTKVGAGRVIGEACHIIDLFCFLTEAEPISVSVEALYTAREDLFPTDNFSVQVSFSDGSVCSLMYVALGHVKLGKERMELFFNAKSIVMEDYIKMYGFGLSSRFNDLLAMQNKGHEELLKRFFHALNKDPFEPPIPFKRLLLVAELTLLIDTLVCQGGGSKDISAQ